MSWRNIASRVIAQVEYMYRNEPLDVYRKALYHAYPFGARENYPYKIWCDEQRKALARRKENHITDLGELFEEQKK